MIPFLILIVYLSFRDSTNSGQDHLHDTEYCSMSGFLVSCRRTLGQSVFGFQSLNRAYEHSDSNLRKQDCQDSRRFNPSFGLTSIRTEEEIVRGQYLMAFQSLNRAYSHSDGQVALLEVCGAAVSIPQSGLLAFRPFRCRS